ncbi:MAG TPA: hypothetical protein VFB90_02925 [Dehalococcoidia bacterium]|nr:hypothetical protein [Dehalococcoidia bacterium]
MARNEIEEAFQEALEALLDGDSVEESLSQHPELADELRPLLETASWLSTSELPAPSLAYQARARARFEAAVRDRNRRRFGRGGTVRWIFPTTVAAGLALLLIAIGSAAFLGDHGNPFNNWATVAGDGDLVLKPNVLQKADTAISRIDSSIRNGEAINPDDVKDLKDANDAIVKAVQSGSLDASSKVAVQEIAGRQLQVLAQLEVTEGAATPQAEGTDAKASITAVVTVVGKALGIPTPVATPVATVTPTEAPQPTPTPAPTETPAPTPTATPQASVQPTQQASSAQPPAQGTPSAGSAQPQTQATPTPLPTSAPSNP